MALSTPLRIALCDDTPALLDRVKELLHTHMICSD